jgi:large subunit ribosomal protein L23
MNPDPRQVIVRALITEKGTVLRERGNQYLFEVAPEANKIEIQHAVERIFSVHVTSVRTMAVRGKEKRVGRFAGKRSDWKKAVVTLRAGEAIELFEQV